MLDSPQLEVQVSDEEDSGYGLGAGIAVAALGTAAALYTAKKCVDRKVDD